MPLNAALISETAFVLHRLLAFERPADGILSAYFREHPKLGRQDRAFIAESAFGVIRHLRSLEFLAGKREPKALLLAWLSRQGGHNLKEFSAVCSPGEIDWLKTVKGRPLSEAPPAVQLDLPDWLHARLGERYGGEELAQLAAALNRPAPLDVRVNTAKMSRDGAQANLAAGGIEAHPTPLSPLGLRLKDKPALNRHPLFLEGVLEVQDEGSQLLALLTGATRGEMVCDFCAGAGGKTLALGAMMRNSGRLYAFDVSEKRLAKLKPRLARSGLSNVHPQLIASENDGRIKRLAGKLDRVLVDAPCSGLGTLRRNPDLKWRQTPESVAELGLKQRSILASASRLLKVGGRLVYATCSLLEEENQAVVDDFLSSHPDFQLLPVNTALASLAIPLDTGTTLRLDPAQHGCDGFFAAILERRQ